MSNKKNFAKLSDEYFSKAAFPTVQDLAVRVIAKYVYFCPGLTREAILNRTKYLGSIVFRENAFQRARRTGAICLNGGRGKPRGYFARPLDKLTFIKCMGLDCLVTSAFWR